MRMRVLHHVYSRGYDLRAEADRAGRMVYQLYKGVFPLKFYIPVAAMHEVNLQSPHSSGGTYGEELIILLKVEMETFEHMPYSRYIERD